MRLTKWTVATGGIAVAMLAALAGGAAEPGNQPSMVVAPAKEADSTTTAGRDYATDYPPERLGFLTRASDLMDTPVWDRAGHQLGKIEDFVLDWNSGKVYCVLVRPRNLYGASNYFVSVPAKAFVAADEARAVINTNLKTLIGSPRFLHAGWDAAAVSNSVAEAYRRFDLPISWDEKAGPGAVGRYSDLLGVDVDNRSGVSVGRLADLVFDLPTERIMFAVVSFYGEDQNLHALPFPAVSVAADRRNLVADVDASKVGGLVNEDAFLNVEMTDPLWVAADYSAYGRKPGFDAARWAQLNQPPPAAEQATTVTPARPQVTAAASGQSPAPTLHWQQLSGDRRLARAVLIAIVQADLADATAAEAVQISAENGVVTLTGQVPGVAQKIDWARIAGSVKGVTEVKNELEAR